MPTIYIISEVFPLFVCLQKSVYTVLYLFSLCDYKN